jgi:putative flavoprotein involved in K+ transport
MPVEHIETLIIGGGQAGLAMSHMLSRRGLRHFIVEQHSIAERWRSERWTGLRFQFPNWSINLPEFGFRHADPDGFATSEEIVDFLTSYATFIKAPVRCGVKVNALRQSTSGARFAVETSAGYLAATNVVVATGPYQRPAVPKHFAGRTGIFEVHASAYKAPAQLPEGAVLIVGSGASGTQIAEELQRAGRRVYLSIGRHRRMPRRYRGYDLMYWLIALGLDQMPVEKRGPDKALPLITGAYGGHTIDFRKLAQQGITLLGRVDVVRDGKLHIAPDLRGSLQSGDQAYAEFLNRIDDQVRLNGFAVPAEPTARVALADPQCVTDPIRELDLKKAGVSTLIWATGYSFDFSWIGIPVLDGVGEPQHRGGVSCVPGLYFLGLPWLSKMNSSFLSGVGDDAGRLADHIRGSEHVRLKKQEKVAVTTIQQGLV